MKTRLIYTRFWIDEYVSALTHKEKLAFLYFFTNERVNICGIYELPDKYIKMDLDLTQSELDKIKQKFMQDNKFAFIDSWVKIINHNSYNNFTGILNEKAIEKELSLIPEKIIQYQYSIDRVSGNPDTLNNTNTNINTNTKEGIVKGSKIPYQEVVNKFNSTCLELPKVEVLSVDRKKQIVSIWDKFCKTKGIIVFEELFRIANESKFLNGKIKNKDGSEPFVASFDWLIKEKNLIKTLEGNYDNRTGN